MFLLGYVHCDRGLGNGSYPQDAQVYFSLSVYISAMLRSTGICVSLNAFWVGFKGGGGSSHGACRS